MVVEREFLGGDFHCTRFGKSVKLRCCCDLELSLIKIIDGETCKRNTIIIIMRAILDRRTEIIAQNRLRPFQLSFDNTYHASKFI